ncbi:hypothetical protein OEZ86_012588 [Tetradesmus obliquus]|nr:hypothetical protein OEZ86_012588 [Tetradesmus obliquus]
MGVALQAVRSDWLALPAAYRDLVPPCKSDGVGADTQQLQQLYARALQLSFCKMGPLAVAGLVSSIIWADRSSPVPAAAAAQQLDGVARYALVCLADPGCRYSLTCWVLAWHAELVQQGGDYSSAAERSSCAAEDRSQHAVHCRRLQRLSQPGGPNKDWSSL